MRILDYLKDIAALVTVPTAVSVLFAHYIPDEYRPIFFFGILVLVLFEVSYTIVDRPTLFALPQGTPVYAELASREVNRFFGGMRGDPVLSVEAYTSLVDSCPYMLVPIVDADQTMVAFFDVFPLTAELGKAFKSGKIAEPELLTVENLTQQPGESNFIYIGTLWPVHYHLDIEADIEALKRYYVLMYSMLNIVMRYLRERYPPRPERCYIVLASSLLARNVVGPIGFQRYVPERAAGYDKRVGPEAEIFVLEASGFRHAVREARSLARREAKRHKLKLPKIRYGPASWLDRLMAKLTRAGNR